MEKDKTGNKRNLTYFCNGKEEGVFISVGLKKKYEVWDSERAITEDAILLSCDVVRAVPDHPKDPSWTTWPWSLRHYGSAERFNLKFHGDIHYNQLRTNLH